MARGQRAPVVPGTLYLVATPIGNLEDITLRAVRVLQQVDLVAAEDTRAARVLLSHHGVTSATISLHKDNEARRAAQVVQRLQQGQALALISEAGTPGISDPGQRVVACCIEAGLAVDVIPGPSAAVGALVLSGLPSEQFTFLGFLPRKQGQRRRLLEQRSQDPATLVIYESPRRLAHTLDDLLQALGDRQAAVVRELTKLHQEVVREPLSALSRRYAEAPARGEVTLVVAGAAASQPMAEEQLREQIRQRLGQGESPRTIAAELADQGRRRVYQMALGERRGEGTREA